MKKLTVGSRIRAAWRTLTWNPAAELEKRRRRGLAFDAANVGRLTADWIPTRLPADDEIRWSLARMRDRARDLERNNALVKQFLRVISTNIIGPDGIKLQSQVKNNDTNPNTAFNNKIEQAWEEWMLSPMRDGKQDFNTMSRLVVRTIARDGEAFVHLVRNFTKNRFGLALELIDPDLIDETLNFAKGAATGKADFGKVGDNEIRLGVEVDDDGRPVAYHGWNKPMRLMLASPRMRVTYPADEIIHLYDPERVNQTRGTSWMTSVMVPMRHAIAYSEAELIAARTGASKMGFFQRKEGTGAGLVEDEANRGQFVMNADPGTFGILPDGYEVAPWTPDHAPTAFSDFMKAQIREIATGLGISYASLSNDLEGVNYSSIRTGMLSERDTWRTLQKWWIGAFLRPLYKEWLNMALLAGAVKLDSRDARRFLDVRWIPRGWAWVDPLKDTQAGVLALGAGLASRTSLLAMEGIDHEEIFQDLADENEDANGLNIDISVKDLPIKPQAPAGGSEEAPPGGNDGDAAPATPPARNGHAPRLAPYLMNGRSKR